MEKKNTLDLTGITAKCDYLVDANLPYYQQLSEAFVVLKLTGCRVSELFEIERWSWLGDDIYSLQPQKGNTLRVVQLNTDCSDFQYAIKNQIKPFGGLTKYQLYNIYDQVKGWDKLLSGDKDISLYVFRYRYTKQLYADGYDVPTIAAMLGYTNTLTVQSYLIATVSEVFTNPPVGFVDIGGVWWSQSNCVLKDSGADIKDYRSSYGDWLGCHYKYDSLMRVISSDILYRLPSYDEFRAMLDACSLSYGYEAGACLYQSDMWSVNRGWMLNAFDLRVGGAGYSTSSFLQQRRNIACFLVAPDQVHGSVIACYYSNMSTIAFVQASTSQFYSARLVINV
jgi:uncharacterized protein (TIGR02145 family)